MTHHTAPVLPRPAPLRLRAVDALRGLVMMVMALDHLRDFLGNAHFDATDLEKTTAPLFLSRWITHFCAPTFFLLAGASALLSIRSGRRTVGGAARFLVVRGLALVVLEQTVLRCLGWYFHFDYHFMNAGVLYGLGGSMVLLGLFVRLPASVSLAVGLAIVLGEAGIARFDLGDGPLGTLLALVTRSRDFEPVSGYHFFVSYPPIPWFGAMALGYGLTDLVMRDGGVRRVVLVGCGAGFLALFAVLRGAGIWDPSPWSVQPRAVFTALSFVNVSKYPPSTPFLLLTLGVALLALAAFDRWPGGRILEGFGRVPLWFYVIHIPLIHAIAVIYSYAAFGDASWLVSGPVIFWDTPLPGSPPSYGLSLGWIYVAWAALLAGLYPVCRWLGARRAR
ncbi:MAG TPA: heparan-alpha-glucosaminide N-acetyltransferase domain-containing protein [Kofleriaceae bacterium]|nr:heparan-alpha-glucosaminide N-acetyltransferase domain-containing protein [Kofleriaceae bacterium]